MSNYRDFYRQLLAEMNAAGLEVDSLAPDQLTRCKTTGDMGAERSGWYIFFDDVDLQTCVFGDWRTGARQQLTSKQQLTNAERQQIDARLLQARREREAELRRRWEQNAIALNRTWGQAMPVIGNEPPNRYLAARGLIVPFSGALRWDVMSYWHDGHVIGDFPTLLGAVTNPDGRLVSLHRTYLSEAGAKASVPTGKKLMPACGSLAGASIKLHPPRQMRDGNQRVIALGIAEGVETSLSANKLFDVPVWSVISANGIRNFTPPRHVKNIYIFADNDANRIGQEAAEECAKRLTLLGHTVRIHTPEQVGTDWNDVLLNEVAL